MAASSTEVDDWDALSLTYKLVSASYRDKAYPDGILRIDETGSEIELRQLTGKKKKEETVVAKFHLEPDADVLVDGQLLRVSELSISLESSDIAREVAELLRRPAREREASKRLSEAESQLSEFLETRQEALDLLARIKVDPRGALLSVESMWTDDSLDPLDAVYSAYSKRVAESLEKMKTSLADAESSLGSAVAERLYALAYIVGVVQDALFAADSDLAQELAALQELGIASTAEDLRMEKPTEHLMLRAHEALAAAITVRSTPG